MEQLPDDILTDSLATFRHQLKHYLFQQSYTDVILLLLLNCCCDVFSILSGVSSYIGEYTHNLLID